MNKATKDKALILAGAAAVIVAALLWPRIKTIVQQNNTVSPINIDTPDILVNRIFINVPPTRDFSLPNPANYIIEIKNDDCGCGDPCGCENYGVGQYANIYEATAAYVQKNNETWINFLDQVVSVYNYTIEHGTKLPVVNARTLALWFYEDQASPFAGIGGVNLFGVP